MESASSANWGSSELIACCALWPWPWPWPSLVPPRYPWPSRMEERELGRRGVVGRDSGRGREVDLGARPNSIFGDVIIIVKNVVARQRLILMAANKLEWFMIRIGF